jgi:hypothetical protein
MTPLLQASTAIHTNRHNRGTATRDFMETSSIGYENVLDWWLNSSAMVGNTTARRDRRAERIAKGFSEGRCRPAADSGYW